jgi:LysR family transcriptional regulator, glycine cleavage system transcriptional activator
MLPPLNALRAFEAAARHQSFSRAAEEIHVTPAAVSHHVRALEDLLGARLFRRGARTLELTEAGSLLLPGVRDGFRLLNEAVARLRARNQVGALTVSASPSFAAKWLVLRLERFHERHAGIEIRVAASIELVDFSRDDVDIAIRYGRGVYPGLTSEFLIRNEVFPVASPALAAKIKAPGDLGRVTLIHDDTSDRDPAVPDWRMWLKAAGAEAVATEKGMRLSNAYLALEAALAGTGVALANSTIAASDIATGRLVRLFQVALPDAFAFWLVYPPHAVERAKVRAFRNWILDEVREISAPSAARARRG